MVLVLAFLFIVGCLFIAFGFLLYLPYLPIRNLLLKTGKITSENGKTIGRIYISLIILFEIFIIFEAIFPSDDFYRQEFKTITYRELPQSAAFISKDSSYPDFHGDYGSSAQIKLSETDFISLKTEMANDSGFEVSNQSRGSAEIDYTHQNIADSAISIRFVQKTNAESKYRSIEFLNDQRTIFVNLIKS
ncbi:hypothetical protein [Flavobacterium silvaticum]|uniref:Uncharacterized protein n=1 Tax=Flavobacterium silvaticum TaxID=1852020 RepID=A0A972JKR6_9FLAO|nr:hypothetical protein [Flavobacterium silvaticum]NMH29397.1 hypothetical protein [Flavobacterium silvaticum]